MAVFAARLLGPTGYGAFTFAIGAATLASSCCSLGWPNLFNRLTPIYVATRNWSNLAGLKRAADGVLIVSGILGATAFAAASMLLRPELQQPLLLGALPLAPLTLAALRRQQLASLQLPSIGIFFEQGFASFATIIYLFILPSTASSTGAISIYALGVLLGVRITQEHVNRRLPPETLTAAPSYAIKDWMKQALPMMSGGLAKKTLIRTDVIVVAPIAGIIDAGLYGAAYRLTYLMTYSQVVLMSVITPKISSALASHDHAKAKHLLNISMLFAFATSTPFLIIFYFFSEPVLRLIYGDDFTPAKRTLEILAFAQFASAFSNANGALLMMGGLANWFSRINLLALIIGLAISLPLVHRMGAVGAAYAILFSYTFILFWQSVLARRLLLRLSKESPISHNIN